MASNCCVTATHAAEHGEVTGHTMPISTILSGLALFSVAFECPIAAAVFGAAAFWLIEHGA